MVQWPKLKHVIVVWAAITVVAHGAYVYWLLGLPADELVMANSLSFQPSIGLIVVGLPSVVFLLLFLLVGAIAKRWLIEPKPNDSKQQDAL